MEKKLVLTLKNEETLTIEGDLYGKDLYKAYVALTAHVAIQLEDISSIENLSEVAVKDAIDMLEALNGYTEIPVENKSLS